MKLLKQIKKEVPFGDCFSTKQFASYVKSGCITDDDGFGYYHGGEQKTNVPVSFDPDEVFSHIREYPYVIWYNR